MMIVWALSLLIRNSSAKLRPIINQPIIRVIDVLQHILFSRKKQAVHGDEVAGLPPPLILYIYD
jgi:hypothetical protein